MSRFALMIGLVIIVGIVEIFADIALKEWALSTKDTHKKHHWGLLAGIGIYAVVGLLYGLSLLFGKLSIANTLWQVFSIVIVFGIGIYLYGEMPTIGQWIGLIIILVGLGCMLTGESESWTHPNTQFWHKSWSPFAT